MVEKTVETSIGLWIVEDYVWEKIRTNPGKIVQNAQTLCTSRQSEDAQSEDARSSEDARRKTVCASIRCSSGDERARKLLQEHANKLTNSSSWAIMSSAAEH